MAKSRYLNSKIISTVDKKKIHSMHGMAKMIDINKLTLIPVTVKENTRLDILAGEYLGNGRYWWVIAYVNHIYWPWNIQAGSTLLIPTDVNSVLEYF